VGVRTISTAEIVTPHITVIDTEQQTQTHALDLTSPAVAYLTWLRGGWGMHDSSCLVVTHLFAALDLGTGKMLSHFRPRHRL